MNTFNLTLYAAPAAIARTTERLGVSYNLEGNARWKWCVCYE